MPEPIIGFGEFISPMAEQDIFYHVEWLTNEQCFPSLSSPQSSKKDAYPSNASNTEWQLIDDNEIAQAEYALPGIMITSTDSLLDGEAEFWEFLQHSPQMGRSYATLATAAQDPLVDSSPIYPFSSIHPYAGSVTSKSKDNAIDKEDLVGDDFYHLYEARKSHGSHSYFGNKNYFERKQAIAYREFWDYWGCGRPEVKPRYLHQCVAFQSHAKQYKPPGPRNANKNKKERNLKPQNRLEL